MPLVDFKCTKCEISEEKLVKDPATPQVCKCGSMMTKQIGKANFELKGKGWYKDGYTK